MLEIIWDTLYTVGLIVVWYGNIRQACQVIKSKSTKSLHLHLFWAMLLSITIRLPRAVTSDYWVWQYGYIISFILMLALVVVIVWHRRRYPRK